MKRKLNIDNMSQKANPSSDGQAKPCGSYAQRATMTGHLLREAVGSDLPSPRAGLRRAMGDQLRWLFALGDPLGLQCGVG